MNDHAFRFIVEDGYVSVAVDCPYDAADETRSCWPYDESGTVREPSPQDLCNIQSWIENSDAADLLHGEWSFPAECDVVWTDGLELHHVASPTQTPGDAT